MPDEKDAQQGRTPAETARELARIQREAADRQYNDPDGVSVTDALHVAAQPIDSELPPEAGISRPVWEDEYYRREQLEGKATPPSLVLAPRPPEPIPGTPPAPPPVPKFGIKLSPELAAEFFLSLLRSDKRFFAAALILGGVWMLVLAFTAARTQYVVVRPAPFVLISPTVAPQTASPAPTSAQPGTPLSAGPIVATFSGTTTSYTVEAVQGSGLSYQWMHSATCGSHIGETTVNYLWDHPHPPCPDEAFHTSFITVQITDGAGFALVRQYLTLGSRPGRGPVPAGGGVFATQTPFPTTAVRTTAPATTAVPTASPITTTIDGAPSYPLGLGGLALTAGGLGLAYIGRKKDPCAELRRREAAASTRRSAAHERAAQLEQLRTEADRTHAEAARTQRAERDSKDDRHSWWEDAETGVRRYTNAGDRGRIEHAEAAARNARAAADAARSAYDAAGGAAAVATANAEQQQADADLRSADAALAACERENAPRAAAPTPAPTPVPPPAPPVAPPPPTPPPPAPPAPPSGPVIAKATPTAVRVCQPGMQRPDSEQSSTHEWRVIDLRSATIVGHGEVSLSEGADGDGPSGERGSGAFPEMFQYWRDATVRGAGRIRNAVTRDERLQVVGEYSIRYTVRLFTITCTTWEECKADGSGYERRHRAGMVETGQTEEQTPPVVADVADADVHSVTREVLKVVTKIGRELQAANRKAEEDAKKFTTDCG